MTASRYRFATRAQWEAGLASRIEPGTAGTLAPTATWSRNPERWAMAAGAAALAPDGAATWIATSSPSATQRLLVLADDDTAPIAAAAPAAVAAARHLVAGRRQLWTTDGQPLLLAWQREGIALRLRVPLAVDQVVDLAADGDDGVWVLARVASHDMAVHVDCAGHEVARHALGTESARGLACILRGDALVLLEACGARLSWVDLRTSSRRFTASLHGARLCADASVVTASRERVVVGGVSRAPDSEGAWIATFDAHGDLLDVVDTDQPPVDLAVGRATLIVTSSHAVLRYRLARAASNGERQAVMLTPALESPPAEGRAPWLRAEAIATLPAGTSVEIAWAGTDDPQQKRRADALLHDAGQAPQLRWHRLREELAFSQPLVFGADPGAGAGPMTCALPLHDVRTRWIWIAVTLVAAPGAERPALHSLEVAHPDESLMQSLPAVYRRQAAQPGDFLRSLVGLLETTTQGLDRRIAGLGQLLDPARADEAWLDAIAGWLGLPWDESLPIDAKRALLSAAETLQSARGTRRGLEALLAAVLPPRRARVVDLLADHGFARLGCRDAPLRLPAMLGGLAPGWLVLGRKARLGRGRLGPDGAIDCGARFAGIVVVELAATSTERRAWSWLRPLLEQFMPLTARLQLRWIPPRAAAPDGVLHAGLTLESELTSRLGDEAVVGSMRLPVDRVMPLDATGPTPGFRLH